MDDRTKEERAMSIEKEDRIDRDEGQDIDPEFSYEDPDKVGSSDPEPEPSQSGGS